MHRNSIYTTATLGGYHSLDEGGKPLETICVADTLHYRAHEDFDWPRACIFCFNIFTECIVVVESERFPQFLLLQRALFVNFVPEDHEGNILELWHL